MTRLTFCFILFLSLAGIGSLYSQSIVSLQSGKNTSIRGLSVMDNSVAWISGSNGWTAFTVDGGKSWTWPLSNPFGYRSAIEYFSQKQILTTGTSGTDLSVNSDKTWINLSKDGYHTVRKAKSGSWVILTGNNGRISEL